MLKTTEDVTAVRPDNDEMSLLFTTATRKIIRVSFLGVAVETVKRLVLRLLNRAWRTIAYTHGELYYNGTILSRKELGIRDFSVTVSAA